LRIAGERLKIAGLNYLSLTNSAALLDQAEKLDYFNTDQIDKIRAFVNDPYEWNK
jgi:hypothetical protein